MWSRILPIPHLFIAAVMLLLAAPSALAAPADDTAERVAQLRTLLASDQGAAILDLLGDPKVRQAILHDADTSTPQQAGTATAGQMMDTMLTGVRARVWALMVEAGNTPAELTHAWARLHAQLPGSELWRTIGFLIVFLAGGIFAQHLFLSLARPWRTHFNNLTLTTLRERASAAAERLLFGTLIVVSFAAGSMGAFLLFSWPPQTGSIILGYLLAFVVTRLSLMATRFFLAPGAEHLRLVPLSTDTAWFWHRWVARLVTVAAIGWQTILTLRSLGMPEPQFDLLLNLLLLLLACLGLCIVWIAPGTAQQTMAPNRGAVPRLMVSIALVIDWLLFLMGASALGWTLLILAAAPIVTIVLSRSISSVALGSCWEMGLERSAYVVIAERAAQALVVVVAAAAMVHVWQIDLIAMSNMDRPMARIGRGLLEALVILVIADLLWQAVRLLIDTRLAGHPEAIDNLDDNELRRRARLHTLLPVLRNFALFVVLVMASLSALAAMGLQIGPLLAGAGVVGIAVGFGAQTLVRDVLSGVFFLVDDAFRVGEYIESGGIFGTVESFSLRSVKLRHLNGQLHTVPFGDLKAITNYSRDWVVERLPLVVIYETDLDLLERTVEAVSDELTSDPATAVQMIEPLKSLGVQAMLDTGMQISLTFKTRPGHQFAVRRAVYRRIKSAFAAAGIRFSTTAVAPSGVTEAPASG